MKEVQLVQDVKLEFILILNTQKLTYQLLGLSN